MSHPLYYEVRNAIKAAHPGPPGKIELATRNVCALLPDVKASADGPTLEPSCDCPHLTTDDIRDFVESRWPAEYPPGSALARRTRKETR